MGTALWARVVSVGSSLSLSLSGCKKWARGRQGGGVSIFILDDDQVEIIASHAAGDAVYTCPFVHVANNVAHYMHPHGSAVNVCSKPCSSCRLVDPPASSSTFSCLLAAAGGDRAEGDKYRGPHVNKYWAGVKCHVDAREWPVPAGCLTFRLYRNMPTSG